MANIGNDKRKFKADRFRHKAAPGNWLSGNMAQIMVFMNGLIVSITAFAILNVFIDQIVQDSFSTESSITRDYVEDRISLLERDVQSAASLVAFSKGNDDSRIIGKFKDAGKELDYLYWLKRQEAGQYLAVKIAKPDAKDEFAPQLPAEMHKYVIKSLERSTTGHALLTGYKYTDKSGREVQPLIIASKVVVYDRAEPDVVYSPISFEKIISPAYLQRHVNIQRLEILRESDGKTMFASEHPASSAAFAQKEQISIADVKFGVVSYLLMDERELFLKKVPFLMLLFGVTLTLIGTLYVRNNQKQSLRLASMNRELEQKNVDLGHEILEREKLNMALRQTERENRSIVDSVSDIIFETATDGKILFLNQTWEKITGFSAERSLGRNLFDLFYMQDQAQQRANFAALVKGQKQSYRAFTRLRTADGTFRAVELAVSMLRADENNVLRVVGAITDVEERRRAERALSEAEKKYRAIVENAASGIYQVTPEGQYLSANPAMAKILGYDTPEEILREVHNASIEIYCDQRARERHLMDVLRDGEVGSIELQVRRRDGHVIWVQENLRAVKEEDGALLYYEGSIEDITQRKETELALREAMVESDLASRSKSEFLANMSHELRTPLNAIIGFSDIIKNQAFGAVGAPEYLDYARDINEGGKRLLQVINDILDVSRVAAGDRQLNESLVDLSKLVASALDILAPKIETSRLVISNFITGETPKLIGEAHAIKQMIINLLSNSIKYTPAGGRVSISFQMDEDGQLHLAITDTGIGLTDVEIEKALSPFGQVETGLNKSETGTGLGLTLVQSLMTLHGGQFELFSQKGVGTTATLIFPTKRVSAPKKPQAQTTTPVSSSEKDPVNQ